MGSSKLHGGLGFRDLEIFNPALLAKQGWRLLQAPDSLVARIMREKYFPAGDFLHAQLGRRLSYAWRSIFNARGVLEEGLIWRVENGETIRIWEDKWLSSSFSNRVMSHVHVLEPNARVCALIDPVSCWWNFTLIHSIFEPSEADRICCMALSPLRHPDKLIWKGSNDGIFSVKSAYNLELNRRKMETCECSSTMEDTVLWKRLWALNAPIVLKNFVWKVCHDLLPTNGNLFNKSIGGNPFCPFCLVEEETVCHIGLVMTSLF